jgi:outer membrane protein OmpA-like peptidoglycan-associated protein
MQDGGIIGQPFQQVVRFITTEKDLANAHGISVTWLNFGAVSGAQNPLSQAQYQNLQEFWKRLLGASSATSVLISGARLQSNQPPPTWPPVSVVPLAAPASFDGPHYSSQGIRLNLHDTIFGSGSATLTAASYATLAQDFAFIEKYPLVHLVISGYTDNVPDRQESNVTLSLARAQAVASWLEANGISSTHITVSGLGPLHPIASNATAAGRAQNRRVSILIEK